MINSQGIFLGFMSILFTSSGCEVPPKHSPSALNDISRTGSVGINIQRPDENKNEFVAAPEAINPVDGAILIEPIEAPINPVLDVLVPPLAGFAFPENHVVIVQNKHEDKDLCPCDDRKTYPGFCGCGKPETDTDKDGIPDCKDNCVTRFNFDQVDGDSDDLGASCDCDDNNGLIGTIQGKARYVDPLGDDGENDCLDLGAPCKTIIHAINEAAEGDTIVLAGAIFNEAAIVVDKTIFIFGQNSVDTKIDAGSQDRVFSVNSNVLVTICGLTIMNGLSSEDDDIGGGVLISDRATVEMRNVTISDNTADKGGGIRNNGTLSISNSRLTKNDANFGGAIYTNQGSTSISNSSLSYNEAAFGGAIENVSSDLTIIDSTFDNNEATFGGGIENNDSNLNVMRSTFSNNIATFGGGIVNYESEVIISNSTLSKNEATFGGGIQNTNSDLRISNSTLSGNKAIFGGGIENLGSLIISHTIVANNPGDDCSNSGTINSNGFNLESATSCGFNEIGDLENANANLLPLANNGGPTMTHALGNASDAIDAGNITCGVNTDQRGEERPVDFIGVAPDGDFPRCDIGSFEKQQ
jgi:hypothetical protein